MDCVEHSSSSEEKKMKEGANNINEGSIAIDADISSAPNEDISCVKSMKQKFETRGRNGKPSRPFTTCRVPQPIRQGDESAYVPKIISIGPYHRDNPSLQHMEEHKWHHLHSFLARNPNLNFQDYIMEMKDLELQSRICYSGNIDMGSDDFVEMMVLDSCFIVDILIKQQEFDQEADAICSESWILPVIAQDMPLLENQLPFFVLERSFSLCNLRSSLTVTELALHFFEHILRKNDQMPHTSKVHHLLHLFHSRLLPTSEPKEIVSCMSRIKHMVVSCMSRIKHMVRATPQPVSVITYGATFWKRSPIILNGSRFKPPKHPKKIPPAVALQDAGIRFCLKNGGGSFLEVEFNDGLMEMPLVSIYDSTNSLFRNFIAFEQCFPECGNHFTSYAMFMDSIVNTEADVAILNDAKIVEHVLGSDQDVAILFNELCKGIAVDFDGSYLAGLFKDVNAFMETRWRRWQARLMRDYFSNPWAILSLIAAIVVLLLTFLQTYFSIYGYFRPPS